MIQFSTEFWLNLAIAIGLSFAILLVVIYKKSPGNQKYSRLTALLKYSAILLILFCLLDPQIISKEPVKGATSFLLLSDNSSSMKLQQPGAASSKADDLKNILDQGAATWQQHLKDDFDFHHFSYDQRLRQIDSGTELKFSGKASDLMHHLKEISERFDTEKCGGILFLTDGIITDKELDISQLNLPPIYPVLLKDKKAPKDIWIQDLSASVSAFEDAPINLNIDINQQGYAGKKLILELLNEKKEILETREWQATGQSEILRLQPQDSTAGIRFYSVKVYAADEHEQFKTNKPLSELTLLNNSKTIRVDRRGGPYKILYVAGRPNWEYKFLARALEKDKKIQLRALIRLAKKEEKFKFRAGRNSNINPLFQGLGESKAQQGENYDEPVYMRINTDDDKELEKGFPNTAAELFKYHAIIIDDCEASFFTADQLSLIRDFVSVRGGGLLMLAGMESLREGNYERSPLKDLLPVYLNSKSSGTTPGNEYKLELTREGWLAPWVRLYDNEVDEQQRFKSMPSFKVLNKLNNVKPGALLLANVVDNNQQKYPALVAQRFGLGRSGVFTIGDFWRLGMRGDQKGNLQKSWRQMLRWLTADVPAFMELKVTENTQANTPVSIEFTPRDKSFQSLKNLNPILKITNAQGDVTEKAMLPDSAKEGLYKAKVFPAQEGLFKATVDLQQPQYPEMGQQQNAFLYQKLIPENQQHEVDEQLLSQLATNTGGQLLAPADIDHFIKNIPEENHKITIEKSAPFWNNFWLLGLIIILLSSEWWLRRTKGMP